MKLKSLLAAALGTVVVVQWQACSVYDESLLSPSTNGEGSTPGTCDNVRWLDPPVGTGNLGGDIRITGALTLFDLGEEYKNAEGTIVPARLNGYDLDLTCTRLKEGSDPTLTEGSSCETQPGALDPDFSDLPGGRDNGLRNLISKVAGVYPGFGTPVYKANIANGDVSILVDITGYNGAAEDDTVQVAVLTPGGRMKAKEFQVDGRDKPKFDGKDVWPVAAESYKGNTRAGGPTTFAAKGYVRNGVLVAPLNNIRLRLRIGVSYLETTDLYINFNSTYFAAKIAKEGDGLWHLREGQIAATWRTDDLFAQLKFFPNPFPELGPSTGPGSTKICTNLYPVYPTVRAFICNAADIWSGTPQPRPPCDSMSVGIGFEGVEAVLDLDNLVTLPDLELSNECGSQFDPRIDTCAKSYEEQVAAGVLPPPPSTQGS